MITYLEIDGFKSFKDFKMGFTPFTIIAGANASGKSNLFDALMLLADLAHTDLKNAFTNQRGNALELFTQYGQDSFAKEMTFIVEMLVDKKVKDSWGGVAELKYTRLRYKLVLARKSNSNGIDELYVKEEHLERIRPLNDDWVKTNISNTKREHWRPKVKTGKRSKPYIHTELRNGIPTIKLPQDGRPGGKETPANAVTRTVLSGIDDVNFPHAFAAREEMKNWKFLQLNPDDLREPTKKQIGMSDIVTQTGRNLAAAYFRLVTTDKYVQKEVSRKLNNFLPNIVEVKVYDDKANNQYLIEVTSEDGKIFTSRVLSEGTLRLLTLCVFLYDDRYKSLLCYEEPENGIHPFRIQFLAGLLNELSVNFDNTEIPLRQILVNTHSPKLVGEIIKWSHDKRVSIWFSKVTTLISQIEARKTKINITKFIPVIKEENSQLNLFSNKLSLSDSEIKITLSQVKRYLENSEFEAV